MKKYLINVSVFTAILVLAVFLMNRNYFPGKAKGNDGYIGAIVDKHAYADKTKAPRIILTGGSSLAFGIDSKMIEKHTGRPVINLGLNGSLGLDFMLNQTRYVMRPTDIVILSAEYYLSKEGSYKFKKEAERIYPPAGKFFDHSLKQRLTDFFVEDFQRNFHITFLNLTGGKLPTFSKNVVYSRSSFNENGDIIRNFEPHPSHDFLTKVNGDYQEVLDIELINKFIEDANKKNVTVYFLFPCLDEVIYKKKAAAIAEVSEKYYQEMKVKKFLNKPEDSVFPDSLFYDTEYHLAPKGRQVRTERLVELLRKHKIVPMR